MDQKYRNYCLLSAVGILVLCLYPILMGVRVCAGMITEGSIPVERYPKYVIPYAPIALSLIAGVGLMPVYQKRKRAFPLGALTGTAMFFLAERIMETRVFVRTEELIPLEGWQMSLCYIPPEQYRTRTWEAVDVLLGGYSPAFKIHFYLISVLIILSVLNCIYGFGKTVLTKDRSPIRLLTVQAVTSVAFLGMCIWACFTAFYRGGEITVAPVSAVLMIVFFILMGVNAGVFSASRISQRAGKAAKFAPVLIAVLISSAMYAGELILLNGNLYRFGTGLLFDGIGGKGPAPADFLVIAAAGALTRLICRKKKA